MAPRRGGGGGGRGGGSIDNECARVGAFNDPFSIGLIAISGVFTGILVLTAVLYIWMRPRAPRMKNMLRWYTYGLSLLLVILGYIVDIIVISLQECRAIDSDAASGVSTLGSWLIIMGVLLLVAVVLFPAVGVLQSLAGMSSSIRKITKYAHLVGWSLTVILAISYLGIYSYLNSDPDVYTYEFVDLSYSGRKLDAAQSFLSFLLIVSAGVNMIIATVKMPRAGVSSGSLKILVPLLTVSLSGLFLTYFANTVHSLTDDGSDFYYGNLAPIFAPLAISRLFLCTSYILLLFIGSARAIGSYDPHAPAAPQQPYIPNNAEGTAYSPGYQPVKAPVSQTTHSSTPIAVSPAPYSGGPVSPPAPYAAAHTQGYQGYQTGPQELPQGAYPQYNGPSPVQNQQYVYQYQAPPPPHR